MIDFDIELTRRRVLASILVIGLATAAAGVGTFALFSDEVTKGANNISAGNMTLTVDNGFSASGLYPTQTTGNKSINLTYSAGPTANLSVESVSTANSNLDWSSNLSVAEAYVEVNGDVEKTYSSMDSLSGLEQENVATLTKDDSVSFIVNLKLERSAGNEFQGENVDISVTFNATQTTQ